jgi:hypothetical protein
VGNRFYESCAGTCPKDLDLDTETSKILRKFKTEFIPTTYLLLTPLALGFTAVAAMVRSVLPPSHAAAALFHCIPGFYGIPVTRALGAFLPQALLLAPGALPAAADFSKAVITGRPPPPAPQDLEQADLKRGIDEAWRTSITDQPDDFQRWDRQTVLGTTG